MGHTKFNNLLAKCIARQQMYWGRIVEYQLFLYGDFMIFSQKYSLRYEFGNSKQLCKNR
jgi:hypothetical protein